jgi:uncharacterized protein
VRFLLGKNPDLTFRAYQGATPLHWAYFGGSLAVIAMLEQAGADTEARDPILGCPPRSFGICVAANWGFEFLVRAGLADDPSLVNIMDGRTSPLHEASCNNHVPIVRLLLESRANPQVLNGAGQTALDLAIEKGHVEVAAMLRTAGGTKSG